QHRFYCGIDLHTRTLSLCVSIAEQSSRLIACAGYSDVPAPTTLVRLAAPRCASASADRLGRPKRSEAISPPLGRPAETCLVLPQGEPGGVSDRRALTGSTPACRAPSPGSLLFNLNPGPQGLSASSTTHDKGCHKRVRR